MVEESRTKGGARIRKMSTMMNNDKEEVKGVDKSNEKIHGMCGAIHKGSHDIKSTRHISTAERSGTCHTNTQGWKVLEAQYKH